MLRNLISSNTRRILLNTFFMNPEGEYYIRQLAAMNHLSVGTVHRELGKLADAGVLKTKKIGNLKLFSLNKDNPVYEELRGLFTKTEGIVQLVKESVSRIEGIAVGFIYGSFTKGKENAGSDVDIFLIGDKINEDELIKTLRKLENKVSKEINYTRYTKEEYKKEKQKKNSFILEVIKGEKVFIKGSDNEL